MGGVEKNGEGECVRVNRWVGSAMLVTTKLVIVHIELRWHNRAMLDTLPDKLGAGEDTGLRAVDSPGVHAGQPVQSQ